MLSCCFCVELGHTQNVVSSEIIDGNQLSHYNNVLHTILLIKSKTTFILITNEKDILDNNIILDVKGDQAYMCNL